MDRACVPVGGGVSWEPHTDTARGSASVFARIHKYQHQFNTLDGLKVIAVLAMVIDHIGAYVLHQAEAWRTLGRLAAPLFFFIAGVVARPRQSEPWPVRTWRDWLRPSLPLLLFGSVLTALNGAMYADRLYLNILLVLLLIKLVLERWDPLTWSTPALVGLAAGLLLGHEGLRGAWLWPEFGLLGPAYALGGRLLAAGRRTLSSLILGATMAVQFAHYWAYYDSRHGLLLATALVLYVLMSGFRFRPLALASWLKNPLLICSRYSLEIYFFHLTALKLYHFAQVC